MLPPVLAQLLLGLAREGALRTRVRPLAAVVHLVLLQLPFGPARAERHNTPNAGPIVVVVHST